jgi:transcriptional regulator with XRE-family HTH domain
MSINTLADTALSLGGFLRDRRARLAPMPGRRRTPGLRREEVAARAGVSTIWYTWLEQGRGGAPSDEVLERLAGALELDASGREILFLLAQQRPPPLSPAPAATVPPALQHVLDGMATSPAVIKTPSWDIVAWNEAARAVLTNYQELAPEERNVLRRLFGGKTYGSLPDWEADARFAVAVFRMDVARAGGCPEAAALAAELHETNADFRRFWAENEVRGHWVGSKRMTHPVAGPLVLETMAFTVDGAEGLSMVVFTPATDKDERAIAKLLAGRGKK